MRIAHDLDTLTECVTTAVLDGRAPTSPEISIRCPHPDHPDENPSASWNTDKGVWMCHGCGRSGGTIDIARLLGLTLDAAPRAARRPNAPRRQLPRPGAADSNLGAEIWNACSNDPSDDRAAARWLSEHGLMPALANGMLRLVPIDPRLPGGAHRWCEDGYSIVQPLYDLDGRLVSVQARSIRPSPAYKVLNPRGGLAKGVVFANERGRAVLCGHDDGRLVLLGEGLTDTAALSFTTDIPILGIPGTEAVRTFKQGPWSPRTTLVIAFDRDPAGDRATSELQRARGALETVRLKRLRWPGRANDTCDVLAARGRDGLTEFISRQTEGLTHA